MKVVNRRVATFSALALAFGIFIGGIVDGNNILTICIPLAIAAAGMLFLFGKHPYAFVFYLCVALGVSLFAIDANAVKIADEGEYEVTARVVKAGENYCIADDVSFDGAFYRGKIKINTSENFSAGEEILFFTEIDVLNFDPFDSYSCWLYCDGVYYEADASAVSVVGNKRKFFEKILDRMSASMYQFMQKEDVGIAKSLLFGDKSDLTADDNATIRGIGLSHVFALSGLHVSFLMGIILFIAKKTKLNKKLTIALSIAVLFVYGITTGFPSGLKRAGIMTLCYLIAPFLKAKRDPLNTLGTACLIILATNPRELFDLSFIMSVSAVLGIVAFYKPIASFIGGKRCGAIRKRFAEGTALTLSANVFLFPVCCNVFNSIAVYSVVANLVLLPLVGAAFSCLAVAAFLSLIFSGFGVLYYPAQFLVIGIRILSEFIYSLPYATVGVPALGVSSALYVLSAVVVSRFIKLGVKTKVALVSTLTVLWALCFVFL